MDSIYIIIMGRQPVWKKITILREVKAKEMFESEVHSWGTGGAHIPFTVDYLKKKVIVIPLER